jgi:hypothetical protein
MILTQIPRKLRISFGGSHRKNAKCVSALKPFLADTLMLPTGLGSKRYQATVFDTPACREIMQRIGAMVARNQPSYLNSTEGAKGRPAMKQAAQTQKLPTKATKPDPALVRKGRLIIAGLRKAKCRWCGKPGQTRLCSCGAHYKLTLGTPDYSHDGGPAGTLP